MNYLHSESHWFLYIKKFIEHDLSNRDQLHWLNIPTAVEEAALPLLNQRSDITRRRSIVSHVSFKRWDSVALKAFWGPHRHGTLREAWPMVILDTAVVPHFDTIMTIRIAITSRSPTEASDSSVNIPPIGSWTQPAQTGCPSIFLPSPSRLKAPMISVIIPYVIVCKLNLRWITWLRAKWTIWFEMGEDARSIVDAACFSLSTNQ